MPVPDVSDKSIQDLISLQGRNAVVTGAARGMGFGICKRLAEAGANIVIGDINETGAAESARKLRSPGIETRGWYLNVTDSASVSSFADRVVSELGGIDIWVNNAGIFPTTGLLEMSDDDWDRVLDTNLKGYFLCAREAGRRMAKADKGGCIVNLASMASFSAYGPGFTHYASSKHGVLGLTKSLAVELGPYRVRVLAVAPTLTATPGLQEGLEAYKAIGLDDVIEQMGNRAPLGRTAEPDDIARVVLFCASDLAMLMTGSVIIVDAGDAAV